MNSKITSPKKILLIVILFNIVVLGSYLFLFGKVKDKNEKTFVLNEDLSVKKLEESELKFINDNLEETFAEREKLKSYFVQEGKGGVAKFVGDIENISNLAKVTLKVNSIILKNQKEGEEKDLIEEVKLSLVINGGWNEVIHFLDLISLAPYNLSIDKAYFEKRSTEGLEEWQGSFNITVLKLTDK